MNLFKEIHLACKDMSILLKEEFHLPKFLGYSIWIVALPLAVIVYFIYKIIKFICVGIYKIIRNIFISGD